MTNQVTWEVTYLCRRLNYEEIVIIAAANHEEALGSEVECPYHEGQQLGAIHAHFSGQPVTERDEGEHPHHGIEHLLQ